MAHIRFCAVPSPETAGAKHAAATKLAVSKHQSDQTQLLMMTKVSLVVATVASTVS